MANCDEVQVVADSKTTTEKSLMGITGIIMEDSFFLVVVFTPLDSQVSQLLPYNQNILTRLKPRSG